MYRVKKKLYCPCTTLECKQIKLLIMFDHKVRIPAHMLLLGIPAGFRPRSLPCFPSRWKLLNKKLNSDVVASQHFLNTHNSHISCPHSRAHFLTAVNTIKTTLPFYKPAAPLCYFDTKAGCRRRRGASTSCNDYFFQFSALKWHNELSKYLIETLLKGLKLNYTDLPHYLVFCALTKLLPPHVQTYKRYNISRRTHNDELRH
jgi:hypothetical protein